VQSNKLLLLTKLLKFFENKFSTLPSACHYIKNLIAVAGAKVASLSFKTILSNLFYLFPNFNFNC
jgi:hypothetical protein